MKYPQCHTTMQPGFIPTGGGILWFRKTDLNRGYGFADALAATSSWLRSAKLEAYRCPRCYLVTFRYGKQVDDPLTFRHR